MLVTLKYLSIVITIFKSLVLIKKFFDIEQILNEIK